ncbi:hypothetical protein GGU11DRAFT_387794 [Lentinula aff. detonsa]|uniref:Uncharacterized protein n=1 Tax=Lentinula aff. detonsa TaxID=2804958 RepID=A0AA38U0T2_9AGAR|nr:hypothetical protein GGU10DRAFT_339578 [Lentinula aff. detonsa]KAJ3802983.1 hypothetical protein GGU11DRAFT_387794 [Lentinula aff. detonsa]
MKIYLKDAIFHGRTFCCCLPVRFGVISMSFLGILFGGLFSILLWFEVSDTSSSMDPHERTAFILAGIVETLLFIASVVGFIGAIVRKQLFITIYTYFTYVHFIINLAVAGFFLYVVLHFSSTAISKACDDTIKDAGAQGQCTDILSDFRTIYIVVALLVLFIELYGALIATRYIHQIKTEKSTARTSRMILLDRAGRSSGGRNSMKPSFDRSGRYSALSEYQGDDISLMPKTNLHNTTPSTAEFNPYEDTEHPRFPSYQAGPSSYVAYNEAPTSEEGYGGGSWTHQQISQDEKTLLRQQEQDDSDVLPRSSSGHGQDRDVKTSAGPPASHEVDPLPQYSPTESSELR